MTAMKDPPGFFQPGGSGHIKSTNFQIEKPERLKRGLSMTVQYDNKQINML